MYIRQRHPGEMQDPTMGYVDDLDQFSKDVDKGAVVFDSGRSLRGKNRGHPVKITRCALRDQDIVHIQVVRKGNEMPIKNSQLAKWVWEKHKTLALMLSWLGVKTCKQITPGGGVMYWFE